MSWAKPPVENARGMIIEAAEAGNRPVAKPRRKVADAKADIPRGGGSAGSPFIFDCFRVRRKA
jgi:hypothetical protein